MKRLWNVTIVDTVKEEIVLDKCVWVQSRDDAIIKATKGTDIPEDYHLIAYDVDNQDN